MCRRGLSGFDGAAALEARGVVPEMADGRNVLCIVTGQDSGGDLSRLSAALEALEDKAPGISLPPAPELPGALRRLSPAQALFAPRERLPLVSCAGRTAGENIVVYPPGVPLVAAGETIEEKHLAYLREMRYNMNRPVEVLLKEVSL